MTRDAQRGKVYAAEQFVRTLFDRSAEHGDPVVEFFGTQLTLPPEARFASAQAVQRYVDEVLSHPAVRARWQGYAPLRVRPRKGATAAHYEPASDNPGTTGTSDNPGTTATIAVPAGRDAWALRELVVLHEIAHHLTDSDPPHGPEFVATFCELAGAVMGPEVTHVLRVVYAREGAR